MKFFIFLFLFFPLSLVYSASRQSTEVKDYCPNAEEGSFHVQLSSYQRLLRTLEGKPDKKKQSRKRRQGGPSSGQR